MEVSEVVRDRLKKLAKVEKRLAGGISAFPGEGTEWSRLVKEYFTTLGMLVDDLSEEQVKTLRMISRSWKLVLLPYLEGPFSECSPTTISAALGFYLKRREFKSCEKVKVHAAIRGQFRQYAADARAYLIACLDRDAEEDELLMFLELCFNYEWHCEALKVGSLLSTLIASCPERLSASMTLPASVVKVILFDKVESERALELIRRGFVQMVRLKSAVELAKLVEGLGFALWYRGAHSALVSLYESILVNLPQSSSLCNVRALWALLSLKSLQVRGMASVKLSTWVSISGMLNDACHASGGEGARLSLALQRRMSVVQLVDYSPTGSECWEVTMEFLQESPEILQYLRFNGEILVLGPSLLTVQKDAHKDKNPHSSPQSVQSANTLVESMRRDIERLKLQKDSLFQAVAQNKSNALDTIYVLDTNVLIDHLALIDQLLRESPIRIAIPSLVLLELDGLVKSARQGKSAEIAARYLDQVDSVSLKGGIHGITIEGRLTRFIRHPEGQRDSFPKNAQVHNIDDAILHIVRQIKNAVLVSDDVNLSLKGQALQAKVLSWNEFHRLFRNG